MQISYFIIPSFILITFLYAFIKKIDAYEAFINGVKKGLKSSLEIFPYMITMYIAISLFEYSNILEDMFSFLNVYKYLIFEIILRPFSYSGSLNILLCIYKRLGANSISGNLGTLILSARDTSIYVIGIYFEAIHIKYRKKVYLLALLADFIFFLFMILFYFLLF